MRTITLLLPAEGSTVSQLKDGHKACMDMDREERVAYFGDVLCRDAMLDVGHQPRPVAFAWSCKERPSGGFTLRVAPAPDFTGALAINTDENSAEVENLLIGTKYYWQVSCNCDGRKVSSPVGTFFTEDRGPRILRVGGVKEGRQPIPYKGVLNMRDLSGYHTIFGRRVRQGMIYRSAGLNNNATALEPGGYRPGASRLNETTLDYMLNHLGIKTDIDFRNDIECHGMTGSPLGPSVSWVRLGAAAYGGMHRPDGQAMFRDFFKAILSRDIYPFIMHCIGGKDRTGSVVFVLSGLLGVSEEELFLEWEMSGFFEYFPGFDHNGSFFHLTRGFEEYPGVNINEKIEAYARHAGISDTEIGMFREIMLE